MNETLKTIIVRTMNALSGYIPKRKGLWLFGAWEGEIYADNSKYLFEYVNNNHMEIDAIWLTRNTEVISKIKTKGYKCYHMFSIKGILLAMRAEAAFETEGNWDVSPFINREKTKVIQLWHGIAGKAANWKDEKGKPKFDEERRKILSSSYWMATSEKYIDIFTEFSGAPRDRFYISGYPRNDVFVNKPQNTMFECLMSSHPDSKWIIYMPTHRNFGKETISMDGFLGVDKLLREKNVFMVYKPHFHELKNVLAYEEKFTNIILAKDKDLYSDVYSYIHYFDLLISDYSSIVYDFLCADKPIVLFTYDLEHYKKADAGLWDFYEEFPAGPFSFTWEETLRYVFELLEEDTWKDKRIVCRHYFHPFGDGNNCERVYQKVLSLCNDNE